MSYHTYITDALVCGSDDHNTSDRSFLLFTRELGMLYASAKSVREERSKHRYALQEFSYAQVVLVRGKGGWRVTGVLPQGNTYVRQESRTARALIRNIVKLLRRLVHGEVPHTHMFDDVRDVLDHTHRGREEVYEEVISLRMLYLLGYCPLYPDMADLLTRPIHEIITGVPDIDGERRKRIESGLAHSQL